MVAVMFAFLAVQSCERYTLAYQAFPALDWLEGTPALDQAGGIPPASVLVQGIAYAVPEAGMGGTWEPFDPSFPVPGSIVRRISGYRDSATITKSPDDGANPDRTTIRLSAIVFYRDARAQAWAALRAVKLDLAREAAGEAKQLRVDGPLGRDEAWVEAPRRASPDRGDAYVVGVRGPVAFEVQVTNLTGTLPQRQDVLDQAARAELLARRVTGEWTDWLVNQPYGPRLSGGGSAQ